MLKTNSLEIKRRKYHYNGVIKKYNEKELSPWMLGLVASTLILVASTLIETISFTLGKYSNFKVVESWTKLCSYSLKFFLRNCIKYKK